MTITFTLTDLLIFTGIGCLIIFTIYMVLTLKSLIKLLNQSTALMDESTSLVNESTKVVTDVQDKSKAVELYVSSLVSNGQGVFKALNFMNKAKK